MITDYHAQYYAYELTRRRSSRDAEKLGQSIFNAAVDLNPHQIDAALFAFSSPLSRGAILADEVGLGKTIEAGLIVSQLWAEKKRRILCILPAALRPQWSRELLDKFFIDSIILESRACNRLVQQSGGNPFEQPGKIAMCSYQFARARQEEIHAVAWDLVIVDEAHRLRNVYKKSNRIARAIREAIGDRPKILLTATPLQSGLMELFGLVSFVDPHIFVTRIPSESSSPNASATWSRRTLKRCGLVSGRSVSARCAVRSWSTFAIRTAFRSRRISLRRKKSCVFTMRSPGINRIIKIVKNRASGFRGLESFADLIFLTVGDVEIPAQIPSDLRAL